MGRFQRRRSSGRRTDHADHRHQARPQTRRVLCAALAISAPSEKGDPPLHHQEPAQRRDGTRPLDAGTVHKGEPTDPAELPDDPELIAKHIALLFPRLRHGGDMSTSTGSGTARIWTASRSRRNTIRHRRRQRPALGDPRSAIGRDWASGAQSYRLIQQDRLRPSSLPIYPPARYEAQAYPNADGDVMQTVDATRRLGEMAGSANWSSIHLSGRGTRPQSSPPTCR